MGRGNGESDKLANGSRVAIVGGGPAGSFFAICLLNYAREKGITPEVTIYQERDFEAFGPKGCKGCAGILSMSLLSNLPQLGLSLPEVIIQARIEHYAVHSPYAEIAISNPEQEAHIVSVYRGGGPRLAAHSPPVSFDGWLLEEAAKRGVRLEAQRVSRIHLGQVAEVETNEGKLPYDLIVLASGVNAKPVDISGLNYVPPQTQVMAQDELYADAAEVEARLGKMAHAFLLPHSGLIFGTLVPKGPFINVSVLSHGQRPVSVGDFLRYDIVRSILPRQYQRACGCRPHTAVGSARNYYGNRFVAIGDAAVSRLYKDGIGSSLMSARQAAYTVVNHGISTADFERNYQPFCSGLRQDNWWGRVLFSVNDRVKDSRLFFLTMNRLVGDEQHNVRGPQPFTRTVWGMFTGSYSYTKMARMAFSPASLTKFFAALSWERLSTLLGKESAPRKLHVGSRRVLILGSGFGGTYVLRRLVPALNRNENVETTMISEENFFLFTPLLHEVAMGGIETRHVAYPIRRLHWRDRFNFILGSVNKIDLVGHKVFTDAGALDFDYLVLALGSVSNPPEFDTAREAQKNTFALKTLNDSILIRNHIIGIFEQASAEKDPAMRATLLTFVVAGAGYTGVQVVTELKDFIRRALTRFYKSIDLDSVRIILVESNPKIVPELHTKLGSYAMASLKQMDIEVRLKSRVTRVGENYVEINDAEKVSMSTLIWVTGIVTNPRICDLDVAKDSAGRVVVNDYMEVPGFPGIYAVGDCASFTDPKSGQPIPPRAHNGVRQAKVAADNILADIRGRDKRRYRYSTAPEAVSLGSSKAMLSFHGFRLYGFLARFIWLVSYCFLVTGTYNRTRIMMDWVLTLIFGRDTTFLRIAKGDSFSSLHSDSRDSA